MRDPTDRPRQATAIQAASRGHMTRLAWPERKVVLGKRNAGARAYAAAVTGHRAATAARAAAISARKSILSKAEGEERAKATMELGARLIAFYRRMDAQVARLGVDMPPRGTEASAA